MIKFLRRRRLGRTSVRGMIQAMSTPAQEVRSWTDSLHDLRQDDLIVRWGCTATINSNKVLNTARAIHQVNDKAGFRMHLMEHAPDLIPHTALDWQDFSADDLDSGVVFRPSTHSRGRNLHVTYGYEQSHQRADLMDEGYYVSQLIPKVAEYRVFVVQGRVVSVAEKTPSNPDDIAWNVAQGGRFDVVSWDNWPLQAVRKSVEAFNLTELDFGGVDVMVDADGKAYVIEINSAPSLTSEYRQQCMAKAFDWIATNGKERIPLISEKGGYRKFIHPCITDRAILIDVDEPLHADSMRQGRAEALSVPVSEDFSDNEGDSEGEVLNSLERESYDKMEYLTGYTNQELVDELKRRAV